MALLCAALFCAPLCAQVTPSGKYQPTPPAAPSTNAADAKALLDKLKTSLDIQQLGPDSFKIGAVAFDRAKREVRIPGRVNMREDAVEYVLVADNGKKHESVLATDARPEQLHLACLLLGMTATNLSLDYGKSLDVPPPNAIAIEAAWTNNGTAARVNLDALVVLRREESAAASKPLAPGKWFYNGSFIAGAGFQAQIEGSIVSLIRDPSALINNPRPDLDNDKIHFPNARLLPPVGAPVEVILRLPSKDGSL